MRTAIMLALVLPATVAAQTARRQGPARALEGQPGVALGVPPLDVSIGNARIQFDVNRPMAQAAGGLVPVTVRYYGDRPVAWVQVPGAVSYPLTPHFGGGEQTIPNADIRALMMREEAAIRSRCTSTLDYHQLESVETVHDVQLPVTVNASDGALVASTTVPYQLGVTCKRIPPLSVAIGYATIEYSIARPLTEAKADLVSLIVKFNGTANVSSVEIPGSLAYPLGAHIGSFEQTIPDADIRAIMKREENAIRDRCKATLDHGKSSRIQTVHDARLPVTVHAPDGAVVASTVLSYQLGLTCTG
jgi:hypothetical protein